MKRMLLSLLLLLLTTSAMAYMVPHMIVGRAWYQSGIPMYSPQVKLSVGANDYYYNWTGQIDNLPGTLTSSSGEFAIQTFLVSLFDSPGAQATLTIQGQNGSQITTIVTHSSTSVTDLGNLFYVHEFNLSLNSNYPGAAIFKDGVDTGEITPFVFTGMTSEIAGVYSVQLDYVVWDGPFLYDGLADASHHFIGTMTPGEIQNPSPADGTEFIIAWDAAPVPYTLSWEAPQGPAPSGNKLFWMEEDEAIDLGAVLTWTTPALAAGTYYWKVVPYITDPIMNAPQNLAPLHAKITSPASRGEGTGSFISFTIIREDEPFPDDIVIDPDGDITGGTGSAGGDLPPGFSGTDQGMPAVVYTLSSTGIKNVTICRPSFYGTIPWYCWLHAGAYTLAAINPIAASEDSFTFIGVSFDAKANVLVIIDDDLSLTLPDEPNLPPVIDLPAQMHINQNESLSFSINQYASDPDGDTLSASVSSNPYISAEVNADIITLYPATNWTGSQMLTITVNDNVMGEPLSAQDTVEIVVTNPLLIDFSTDSTLNNNIVIDSPDTVPVFSSSCNAPFTLVSWAWDFDDDGLVDSSLPNPQPVYSSTGLKNVRLSASDGIHYSTVVKTEYITVLPGEYIPPAVVDEDLVFYSDNTYNIGGELQIEEGVNLIVQPGAEVNMLTQEPLVINGNIVADGAVFQNSRVEEWGGIVLNAGATNSSLSNLQITGASTPLELNDCSPALNNLSLIAQAGSRNPGTGLKINANSAPTIQTLQIHGFGTAIKAERTGPGHPALNISNVVIERGIPNPAATDKGIVILGDYWFEAQDVSIEGYPNGVEIYGSQASQSRTRLTGSRVVQNESNRSPGTAINISAVGFAEILADTLLGFDNGIIANVGPGAGYSFEISNVVIERDSQSPSATSKGIAIQGDYWFEAENISIEGYANGVEIYGSQASQARARLTGSRVVQNESNRSPGTAVSLSAVGFVEILADTLLGFDNGIIANVGPGTGYSFEISNVVIERDSQNPSATSKGIAIQGDYWFEAENISIEGYANGVEIYGSQASQARARLTGSRVVQNESNRSPGTAINLSAVGFAEILADTLSGFDNGIVANVGQGTDYNLQISRSKIARQAYSANSTAINVNGFHTVRADSLIVENYATAIATGGGTQYDLGYSLLFNCGSSVNANSPAASMQIRKNIISRDQLYGGQEGMAALNLNLTSAQISNNTIYAHPASLILNGATSANLVQNILWPLFESTSLIQQLGSSTLDARYNDIRMANGVFPGIGNINLDPRFTDPENQDLNLGVKSRCIDAGDPAWPLDPDGSRADLGALFFNQNNMVYVTDFNCDVQTGPHPLSVHFYDDSAFCANTWAWDFNLDGIIDSTDPNPVWVYSQPGNYSVSLHTSGGGHSSTAISNNLISALNLSPQVILPIADITLQEDFGMWSVLLSEHFSDSNSDPLSYTVELSGDLVTYQITDQTLQLSSVQNAHGSVSVSVTANDGQNRSRSATLMRDSCSTSFNVTIQPVNDAPQLILPFENLNLQEDFGTWSILLSEHFSDPEGDALSYTASLSSDLVTYQITGQTLQLFSVQDAHGSVSVTVTANDGQNRSRSAALMRDSCTASFTITIQPVNDAPQLILPFENLNLQEDFGTWSILLSEHFSDPDGDALSYTAFLSSDLVTYQITGQTLQLSSVQDAFGNLHISVTADDGQNQLRSIRSMRESCTSGFDVTIEPVNDVPQLVSVQPEDSLVYIVEGMSIDFGIEVLDVDSQLTYTWLLDEVEQNNDAPQWSHTFEAVASYTVAVLVSDGFETVGCTWNVIVDESPTDDPLIPVVTGLLPNLPNPFREGTTIRFANKDPGWCDLAIFNSRGQLIKRFETSKISSGWHQVFWDGSDDHGLKVSAGIYLVRLCLQNKVFTRKILLLR